MLLQLHWYPQCFWCAHYHVSNTFLHLKDLLCKLFISFFSEELWKLRARGNHEATAAGGRCFYLGLIALKLPVSQGTFPSRSFSSPKILHSFSRVGMKNPLTVYYLSKLIKKQTDPGNTELSPMFIYVSNWIFIPIYLPGYLFISFCQHVWNVTGITICI